jgi:hypothetical protein
MQITTLLDESLAAVAHMVTLDVPEWWPRPAPLLRRAVNFRRRSFKAHVVINPVNRLCQRAKQ